MRSRLSRPATTIAVAGGFTAPDLRVLPINSSANNGGFDDDLAPFPSGFHSFDATGGRGGSGCARATWLSGSGAQFSPCCLVAFPRRSEVYMAAWLRVPPGGIPQGNVKGPIYAHDSLGGGNIAAWYSDLTFTYAFEGQAATVGTGVHWGTQPQAEANYGIVATATGLADNTYHHFEFHLNRNAGIYTEARLWVDGIAVVLPPGDSYAFLGAFPDVQYVGGSRALNQPSIIRAVRQGSAFVDYFTFLETLSDPESNGDIRIDDIAVSTTRIGMWTS